MAFDLTNENSVFKERYALSPKFIPHKLLYRDRELQTLRRCLDASKHLPPHYRYTVITGGRGWGKSTLARSFALLVETEGDSEVTGSRLIDVDCLVWGGGPSQILHGIIKSYVEDFPSRGYSLGELRRILSDLIEKNDDQLFIIFNDFDFLLHNASSVGWERLQGTFKSEVFDSRLLQVIYVLSNTRLLERLSYVERGIINSKRIELRAYSKPQLRELIRFRASLAFRKGALGRGVLDRLVEKTLEAEGDLGYAVELMMYSGEMAERMRREEVTLDLVTEAEKAVSKSFRGDIFHRLERHERLLLLSLARGLRRSSVNKMAIREVERGYSSICRRLGLRARGHTRIHHLIEKLTLLNIIGRKISGVGYRGKTSFISLNDVSPEFIEEKLGDTQQPRS